MPTPTWILHYFVLPQDFTSLNIFAVCTLGSVAAMERGKTRHAQQWSQKGHLAFVYLSLILELDAIEVARSKKINNIVRFINFLDIYLGQNSLIHNLFFL